MTNAKKRVRVLLAFLLTLSIVSAQMLTVFADIISVQNSVTSVSGTGTALKATVTGNNFNELENTNVQYNVNKDGTGTAIPLTATGGNVQTVAAGVYQRTFDVKINKADYTEIGNYTAVAQAVYGTTQLASNSESIFSIQNANLLDFNITDSVINPSKPVLYFTDKVAKKLYSYNYETNALASLSFDLSPESLTFANNEVYVSLLKAEHNSYMNAADERGAVAFVDPDTLTLKDTMDVAIDPFDIVADNSGYIYISSGSSQWTKMKSYSRATKLEVDTTTIYQKSNLAMNPVLNRIYAIDPNHSPVEFTAYNFSSGKFSDPKDPGGYSSSNNWIGQLDKDSKVSPDGKYIFNGAGTVFASEVSKYGDMRYLFTLKSKFNDIAFDIPNNIFYTSTHENVILAYNYSNFEQLGAISLSGTPKALYLQGGSLLAVIMKNDGKYYLEKINTGNVIHVTGQAPAKNEIKLEGALTDGIFDSARNRIYAVDGVFKNLFIIDAASKLVTNKIKLDYRPSSLCLSEDGSKIFIVNDDEDYLVSEINADTLQANRYLNYKSLPDIYNHRHIYNKAGKLYVVRGNADLEILLFDSSTFNKIDYIVKDGTNTLPFIGQTGDIAFSNDGNYLYHWKYSEPFGSTFVTKYSINNNTYTKMQVSGTSYLMDIGKYDSPIFIMENSRSLITQKKVYNMDNLTEVKAKLPEDFYAIDTVRGLAFGKNKVYSLADYSVKGYTPVQAADNLIVDNAGNLYMIDNDRAIISYSDLSDKEITGISINGVKMESVIDSAYGEATFRVPYNTNITSLAPTVSVSGGAIVTPASTSTQDFTNPVVYTVTAIDGTIKPWILNCVVDGPQTPTVMRKITGKVYLGGEPAPAGGLTVTAAVYDTATRVPYKTIVNIQEGAYSSEYSFDVPKGKYQLYYSVDPSTGYLPGGGFISNETNYGHLQSRIIDVTNEDNSSSSNDIKILKNRKVKGTLYLPNGEVTEEDGLAVKVNFFYYNDSKSVVLTFPKGVNSQDFEVELPDIPTVLIYYSIISPSLLTKYQSPGHYSNLGTMEDSKRYTNRVASLYDSDLLGAKLTMIPIGATGPVNPIPAQATGTPVNTGYTGAITGISANTTVTAGDNGVINAKPVLDSSTGTAVVTITNDTIDNALKTAPQNSDSSRSIGIELEKVEGADSYSVVLKAGSISDLPVNTVINIETGLATVAVPVSTLSTNGAAPAGTVSVTVGEADKTKLVGDKPVIDLSIKVGEKVISTLDKNITVSIPYQPTAEELNKSEHLVIQYVDSNGKLVTIPNGKYNKETGNVEFRTDRPGNYGVAFVFKTFADLKNHGWAQKEVEVLSSKGIINGVSEDKFDPESNITRADFIMLLVNALELKGEPDSNFSDVKPADYYYNALGTAKKLGLVLGTGDNESRPGDEITRQDMMVLVSRALQIAGKKVQNGSSGEISQYADGSSISSYAVNDIAAMTKEGILKGDGEMLKPLNSATRAEAAVIIYRIYSK